MRGIRVWARLLGLRRAVVEDVRMGIEGVVIVSVRPGFKERDRCGVCRRRCPGYDLGEGRRRWRALDLGTTFAFVESDAPRVSVGGMASWSARSRGPAMTLGSPERSRTRSRGWR